MLSIIVSRSFLRRFLYIIYYVNAFQNLSQKFFGATLGFLLTPPGKMQHFVQLFGHRPLSPSTLGETSNETYAWDYNPI